MTIDGKQAKSVRLHCPDKQCPGYIADKVLFYLLEDQTMYIWGNCGECGKSGSITLPLAKLMDDCLLNQQYHEEGSPGDRRGVYSLEEETGEEVDNKPTLEERVRRLEQIVEQLFQGEEIKKIG